MNRSKRAENRSRILSPERWQRLQDAIAEKFGEACRDKAPFQQLSNLSELPGERPLDPDTVSKIWRRKKGVYRSKLERLFTALKLELNQSDHISFSEGLNTEILAPDTKASTKPPRESVESDAGSIEKRIFKATNQLDPERPMFSRISGIQALGEIAKDSPRYHWQIMEVLAAFVRTNAPRKEEEEGDEERSLKLREDIQAALTVIGWRDPEKNKGVLDLSSTDLRGANLREVELQGINLSAAQLQGADFCEAKLQGAYLIKANLKEAQLVMANLEGAYVHQANLEEAKFLEAILRHTKLPEANLKKADFCNADLGFADLRKTNLEFAKFDCAKLTGAQLSQANLRETYLIGADLKGTNFSETDVELKQIEYAFGDSTTVLPNNVERPAHWM